MHVLNWQIQWKLFVEYLDDSCLGIKIFSPTRKWPRIARILPRTERNDPGLIYNPDNVSYSVDKNPIWNVFGGYFRFHWVNSQIGDYFGTKNNIVVYFTDWWHCMSVFLPSGFESQSDSFSHWARYHLLEIASKLRI